MGAVLDPHLHEIRKPWLRKIIQKNLIPPFTSRRLEITNFSLSRIFRKSKTKLGGFNNNFLYILNYLKNGGLLGPPCAKMRVNASIFHLIKKNIISITKFDFCKTRRLELDFIIAAY